MRKEQKAWGGWYAAAGALAIMMVMTLALFADTFSFVSNAQGTATVKATSANIRQNPDAGSTIVGSLLSGDDITINSEVTGSDGAVWYQVNVNANEVGYIRSDLVERTDGGGALPQETPPAAAPTVAVTDVQPLSAVVAAGQQSARVRADASTDAGILDTLQEGAAVTVTGRASGTDGKDWYRVSFAKDGAEVTGFVRSDFLTLSGELLPNDGAPVEGTEVPEGDGGAQQPAEPEPQPAAKDYDTAQKDGEWYLLNNAKGVEYPITDLINAAEKNAENLREAQKTVKGQKIAIIIMVFVIVVLVLAVTMLIFKVKDVMDEAYFTAVEKETMRERGQSRGTAGKKVMQTVGAERPRPGARKPENSQVRPAAPASGARPAAEPARGQDAKAREVQGRPAGGPPRQTPVDSARRPGGTPPQLPRDEQKRPAVNPSQTPPPSQKTQRPAPAQQTRPMPARQPAAPASGSRNQKTAPKDDQPNPGWKSRNFMADEDDEFEFEFLNWDGDDNQ